MEYCSNCEKKIGFLNFKHYKENDKGEIVSYCKNCYYYRSEKLLYEYCKKYLHNKDENFKEVISFINQEENLIKFVKDNKLDMVENFFKNKYYQAKRNPLNTSKEYDRYMLLENSYYKVSQFIQDLMKLKKVFIKKNIRIEYIQILKEFAKLLDQEEKEYIEKITIPAFDKISNITTTNKKRIIKEFLELHFGENLDIYIENLFDKFKLSYTNDEINNLLNECIEEKELEDFENNLGIDKKKQIGGFENLNGYEFENYLKDVFSIKGYEVVITKQSGDQGADIIIRKNDEKTVVQAKKYSGSVSNKAIQEVVAAKKHYGATKSIVITSGKFTQSAIELALSNEVELWDGEKLKKIVENINSSWKMTYAEKEMLKKGLVEIESENHEEAIEILTNLINLNPELEEAYAFRGNSYFELKRYNQALIDYTRVIEMNPSSVGKNQKLAYGMRGFTYSLLKEFDKALEDFNKCIELDANNSDVYNNRAYTYRFLNRYDEAIKDWEKAIQINPELENELSLLIEETISIKDIGERKKMKKSNNLKTEEEDFLKKGDEAIDSGNYEEAIKAFEKVIELDPDCEKAYFNLGNTYYQIKKYDKAIDEFTKGLEINPNIEKAYVARAETHFILENYEDAIKDYDKYLELNPLDEHAIIYCHRGMAYGSLKKYEEALKDWQKAIKLDPEFESTLRPIMTYAIKNL